MNQEVPQSFEKSQRNIGFVVEVLAQRGLREFALNNLIKKTQGHQGDQRDIQSERQMAAILDENHEQLNQKPLDLRIFDNLFCNNIQQCILFLQQRMNQEVPHTFEKFLEKYKILSLKSQHSGGQGKIYVNESKRVCVKQFDQTKHKVTKVTKEISLLLHKKQPEHVVRIISIFDQQEQYCHAMEYGQSDLEKTYKQCSTFQKLGIMHQMTLAVKEIHDLNIIHRDVKLENFIQFKRNNRIIYKLTDFGISQFPEDTSQDSCGTYYIMAPEQFQDYCKYDQTIDNWALGSNFYKMLTTKQLLNQSSKDDAKVFLKTISQYKLTEELNEVNGEFLSSIICGLLKHVPSLRMSLNSVLAELELLILKNPEQIIKQHRITINKDKGTAQFQSFMGIFDKLRQDDAELINYYPQIVDPNNKDANTLQDDHQLQFESINIWNFNAYNNSFRVKILQFITIILRNIQKTNTLKEIKKVYEQFAKIDDFPISEILPRQLQQERRFSLDIVCDIFSEISQYDGQETVIIRDDYKSLIIERNLLYQDQLKKLDNYEHIFHRFIKSKHKTTEIKYTYCLNFEEPFQQLPGLFQQVTQTPCPYNVLYIIPQDYQVESIDYTKINDFLNITYQLLCTSERLSYLGYQFHPISNNIIKYKKSLHNESIYECLPTNIIMLQDIKAEEMNRLIFIDMLQYVKNQDVKSFFKKHGCEYFMGLYEKGMNGNFQQEDLKVFEKLLVESQLKSEVDLQLQGHVRPEIQIDSKLANTFVLVNNYLQQEVFAKIQAYKKFRSIKLLYRSSRDGLIYEKIRDQCFNQGRFMMLIKPFNHEIIGGYSPLVLQAENRRQSDPDLHTFVFSLTRGEIYPLKKEAQDQAIISSYSDGNKFYYFHFGDFDVFLTIPSKDIADQQFPNFKTEFPRSFDTENYPDVPPSHDDEKDQYLIKAPNGQNLLRGNAKIVELEIFGFEEL